MDAFVPRPNRWQKVIWNVVFRSCMLTFICHKIEEDLIGYLSSHSSRQEDFVELTSVSGIEELTDQ